MTAPAPSWGTALLVARALAIDPAGLGGLVLRARSGPVRNRWLAYLEALTPDRIRRLPPDIADDRLLGGMDLAATLKSGRPVAQSGLLAEAHGGIVLAPMAERMSPGLAARLAAVLDRRRVVAERAGQAIDAPAEIGLVLLDEGAEPDEVAPAPLVDRLAFHLDLTDLALGDTDETFPPDLSAARAQFAKIRTPNETAEILALTAASFGIGSARAPVLALRTARVLAGLASRKVVTEDDITQAAMLVLGHRATQLPATEAEEPDSAPPPPEDAKPNDTPQEGSDESRPLEDKVLEAVASVLPDLALAEQARRRTIAQVQGAGSKQAATHGRPAGTMRGGGDGRTRLDLLATLREAAPWQTLRGRENPDRTGLIVKPEDFRAKRYVRPAESVLIFVVDASGSAAAARLAEAKGAVELMLSEAYRRREKVALIAFRGAGAELLLPPTRSLLQAKRRLAVLPGGGGTPLASAILAGHTLARQIRQRGATPFLVFLTDGRGNIALDGSPGRPAAAEDAATAARMLAGDGFVTVLVDTANRPQADAKTLARHMDAQYLPLPRADARGLSRAVRSSTAPA
ncbi:MAG: magnesium chelatase subunit D [Paracoccaceae bacterium]